MRPSLGNSCLLLACVGSLATSCGGDPSSPAPDDQEQTPERDAGGKASPDGSSRNPDASNPKQDANVADRGAAVDAGNRKAVAIRPDSNGWVSKDGNSLGIQGGWSTATGAGSSMALTIEGNKLCFRGETAQVQGIALDGGAAGRLPGAVDAASPTALGDAGDAGMGSDARSESESVRGSDAGDAGLPVDGGDGTDVRDGGNPTVAAPLGAVSYDYATYWGASGALTLCQQAPVENASYDAGGPIRDCSGTSEMASSFAGVRFTVEGTLPRELRVVFRQTGRDNSPYVAVRGTGQVTALVEEATIPAGADGTTAALNRSQLQAVEMYAYPSRGSAKPYDFCISDFEVLAGQNWSSLPDWVGEPGPGRKVELAGINLAGAEFGETKLPGTYEVDYIYPSSADVDIFAKLGMNVIRLPFRWERLQRAIGQDFDADELARLQVIVKDIVGRKMRVILDPHNYARYDGKIVGADLEASAFANFWGKLAGLFADNDLVVFGLMNEPHDMSTETWLDDANAAIAAIREAGAKNLILVPGNGWTGGHSWSASFYGTPNADVMSGVVDPENRFVFELHQYLDADSSGGGSSCVSDTIGAERLADVTAWLRAHGRQGFLGEFGSPPEMGCLKPIDNLLAYVGENSDVWMGWTAWAAGPWWGESPLTLQPRDNGKARPQVLVLERHLTAP